MNRWINLSLAIILAALVPTTSQARYLNPNTGRFQTMDSYEGNNQDLQSLHKYNYCRANAANLTDPSGRDAVSDTLLILDITASLKHNWSSPSALAGRGAGVGGPDVTATLKRTLLDVERTFFSWEPRSKKSCSH